MITKEVKVVFVIVGIIMMLIPVAILMKYGCGNHKEDAKVENLVKIRYLDTTTHWKDAYNREHAQKLEAEGTLSQVRVAYSDVLKTKTKELGVKEKDIRGITSFSTERNINLDSVIAAHSHTDTVKTGDTIRIRTTVDKNITIPVHDSLSISLINKATRKGFLGLFKRKRLMTDVVSYEPGGVKINDIQSFSVKDPVSRWGLGPSAGYGMVLQALPAPSWWVGVTLHYDLIRF